MSTRRFLIQLLKLTIVLIAILFWITFNQSFYQVKGEKLLPDSHDLIEDPKAFKCNNNLVVVILDLVEDSLTLERNYIGDIAIGTPLQLFKVVFDTTFKFIWIPEYAGFWSNLNFQFGFKQDQSSSYHGETSSLHAINYKGVELLGVNSTDEFIFRGEHTSFKQDFHLIRYARGGYLASKSYVGVIGLQPSSSNLLLSIFSNKTDELGQWKQIENASNASDVDASFMKTTVDSRQVVGFLFNQKGAQVIFGGVDDRFDKRIIYHKLACLSKWSLLASLIQFGDKTLNCGDGLVQLDTGLNFIVAPAKAFDIIKQELKAERSEMESLHRVSCLNYKSKPSLELNFEGKSYSISPEIYLRQTSNGSCYLQIKSRADDKNQLWTLGTSFLSNYYTVFDYDRKRIGFAAAKLW